MRPWVQLFCMRTLGLGAHQISPVASMAVTQIKLLLRPIIDDGEGQTFAAIGDGYGHGPG